MSEVIWDSAHQRWLGYGGRQPFISTDPYGLPGTWYGYYAGGFTQHIDVTAPTPPMWRAPELEKANVTWGGLTHNSYLKQFILTWMPNGDPKTVRAAFSPDGFHWGPSQRSIRKTRLTTRATPSLSATPTRTPDKTVTWFTCAGYPHLEIART